MSGLRRGERWILKFLDERDGFASPTEIGCRSPLTRNMYGSPWASPKCLRLTKLGLLERSEHGHYRITDAGRAVIRSLRPETKDHE